MSQIFDNGTSPQNRVYTSIFFCDKPTLSKKNCPWKLGLNTMFHQENMSVKCIPPQTPLLYRKVGICRGLSIFLIFAPKHRLWVLVRTALPIYVLSENKKNIKNFQFLQLRKNQCITWGVYVMFFLCRLTVNRPKAFAYTVLGNQHGSDVRGVP